MIISSQDYIITEAKWKYAQHKEISKDRNDTNTINENRLLRCSMQTSQLIRQIQTGHKTLPQNVCVTIKKILLTSMEIS